MIYLDSSVALAHLFGEGRSPPETIWQVTLGSSVLLEYEIWNRIHARGLGPPITDTAATLISQLRLVGMTPTVLARALTPFPVPVRTLDGLHLATIEFLRRQGEAVELASYDSRFVAAARALGVPILPLP